ncbi:MAG: ComEC/Rec2 family competence protein [Mycoplasmataceae bacterium]|jgi:competence protein ComEC|nr:ComEC/Rec2 family competence protein [Mycoplasmataceae bacterium]
MFSKNGMVIYHFILPFIICTILLLAVYGNNWYFSLLICPLLYLTKSKIGLNKLIFHFLVISFILCISLFFRHLNVWEHLSSNVDSVLHFSLRNKVKNFIDSNYDQRTKNFIDLLLLNVKEATAKNTYYHMIDLSIVYLIVVSGFHISIFKRIIQYIFKSAPKIGNIVNIIIICLYCYLLNFAISVTRVFFMFLISWIFKRKIHNYFDVLGLAGIISLIFSPFSVFNIGFCMSYLCTGAILCVNKLSIENFLLEKILINIAAIIVSLPFVIQMQAKISIWVIFNSFVFSYLFMFVFIYFLLAFWIIWIAPIHRLIVLGVEYIINTSWTLNSTIPIKDWTPCIKSLYFIGISWSIKMLQCIRY